MRGSNGGRTVVLGADSLDLVLVEKWAAQGLLPFFDSMLRNDSLVRLCAVSRVLQGALWPNLLTGRSPGQHGTFYLTQLTSGTYVLDQVAADHVSPDPYYGRLDANGVRCAIVDVPNDMPVEGFKGLHVVDWLTEFQFWRFSTQPGGSKREIEERFGVLNKSGGFGPTIDSLDGHRQLRRRLEKSMAMKSAFIKELLERDDLDHIFVVFAEPHKAGHFLWKYMDPAHPDHVATEPYLRDAVLGIYQRLDETLADLSSRLGPNDNLLIFSDHGMQGNYRGDQFVGTVLERLGLFAAQRSGRSGDAAAAGGVPEGALRRFGSALRTLVKEVAPPFLTRPLRARLGEAAQVDWSRTRVFQLPTDRNSYLRVNLRGREPKGVIAPGKDYEELLALIESEFRALVNVDTGRPAVEAVFKVHEMYPGPRVEDLPDVVILWASDAPIKAVESPHIGRIELRVSEDRSGNHRSEGFLLARGPGIRPRVRNLQGDILQFPATMLALHGIAAPDHYEMAPLEELLAAP